MNLTSRAFSEYRCKVGKNLLCKARGLGHIEIVNPKNRVINYVGPSRKFDSDGLRGIEFQQNSYPVNCSKCKRLLARTIGFEMEIEIKCKHCKTITLHNTDYKKNKFLSNLPIHSLEKIIKNTKNLTL